MRIPQWSAQSHPLPDDLLQAVLERRQGHLHALDYALLWSEPVTRGWTVHLKNIRKGLSVPAKWTELGICTIALLTKATYEFHHHAPDFLAAGGTQAELDLLQKWMSGDPRAAFSEPGIGPVEYDVIRYAVAMTLDVQVPDDIFNAMQAHVSTTGMVELTASIATYNMVSRFLIALKIE
jgi:alkylhydroperoxidase family enzyme